MWEWFWKLLYPPRCAGCGKEGSATICSTCQIWDVVPENGNVRPPEDAFVESRSAFCYSVPLRKIIWQLKFRNKPALAEILGKRMADQLESWISARGPFDGIIPVPATRSMQRMRGFNQAELLAKRVGMQWNIPVYPNYLVRNHRATARYKLGRDARWRNVDHVFRVPPQSISRVQLLQKILLVDDIYTTGSTAVACARALREVGVSASSIFVATLSRVYNPPQERYAIHHSRTWNSHDSRTPGICGQEVSPS